MAIFHACQEKYHILALTEVCLQTLSKSMLISILLHAGHKSSIRVQGKTFTEVILGSDLTSFCQGMGTHPVDTLQ